MMEYSNIPIGAKPLVKRPEKKARHIHPGSERELLPQSWGLRKSPGTGRRRLARSFKFVFRTARNALKPVGGKFNHLIYKSVITSTQRTMHGRRVFVFRIFDGFAGFPPGLPLEVWLNIGVKVFS
jgi:hypothetical protein